MKMTKINRALLLSLLCLGLFSTLAACSVRSEPDPVSINGTSVPLPITKPAESTQTAQPVKRITDPQQITSILVDLQSKRTASYLAGNGWRHVIREIIKSSGDLHGTAMEWWIHHSQKTTCPEVMQTIIGEDGQASEVNLLLPEDSLLADEIQPDATAGSPKTKFARVNNQSCSGFPELQLEAINNILADPNPNLNQTISADLSENKLILTAAWDDSVRQVTTLTIDRSTGFLTQETIEISNLMDGKFIGSLDSRYTYESADPLPQSVQGEFARALAENK
jgi:hypothetical protein